MDLVAEVFHGALSIDGLKDELKYALVWGTSAKHQPMRVGKDHVLHDEDVVQIVKSA